MSTSSSAGTAIILKKRTGWVGGRIGPESMNERELHVDNDLSDSEAEWIVPIFDDRLNLTKSWRREMTINSDINGIMVARSAGFKSATLGFLD